MPRIAVHKVLAERPAFPRWRPIICRPYGGAEGRCLPATIAPLAPMQQGVRLALAVGFAGGHAGVVERLR